MAAKKKFAYEVTQDYCYHGYTLLETHATNDVLPLPPPPHDALPFPLLPMMHSPFPLLPMMYSPLPMMGSPEGNGILEHTINVPLQWQVVCRHWNTAQVWISSAFELKCTCMCCTLTLNLH